MLSTLWAAMPLHRHNLCVHSTECWWWAWLLLTRRASKAWCTTVESGQVEPTEHLDICLLPHGKMNTFREVWPLFHFCFSNHEQIPLWLTLTLESYSEGNSGRCTSQISQIKSRTIQHILNNTGFKSIVYFCLI